MGGLVRRTRADERGDTRSLERRLERTLYLMVKRREVAEDEDTKGGEMSLWGFPTAEVEGREGLKEVCKLGSIALALQRMIVLLTLVLYHRLLNVY